MSLDTHVMANLIILSISVLLFCTVILWKRPERCVVRSGLITGLIVTILNTIVEGIGASLDVYYVSGPLTIWKTPAPLFITWILLTFLYCLGYSLFSKDFHNEPLSSLYILAGIVAGWLFDYSGWRYLDILRLGEKGNPFLIATVWIIFVPLSIGIYRLISSHTTK